MVQEPPPEPHPVQSAHFMVNDTMYWGSHSAYSFPPVGFENFEHIGDIQFETNGTPSRNFEAYGLPIGTPLYVNPEIPYHVYTKEQQFITVEASWHYVFHDDSLYISADTAWHIESDYYESYAQSYPERIPLNELPADALYLGKTQFEGYDIFPSQELGTNYYQLVSEDVYINRQDENILYRIFDNSDEVQIYFRCPESN